ncbi:MAG: GSCFA domain-containing protein, partial [Bacteroidales bacterium]|nr:GSCFA domain-containing protein [Bacteroidales bacterium]
MKLQTPVTDEICRVGISYSDRMMLLGSCFSDNIGGLLRDYGFDVLTNPFGTLYNPVSVTNSLKRISGGWEFGEDDCVQMGSGSELFCSFSHHTSFARRSPEEFISNANESLRSAAEFYRTCNKVIVTLGTSWCYQHRESGEIVSNCLKRNSCEFEKV